MNNNDEEENLTALEPEKSAFIKLQEHELKVTAISILAVLIVVMFSSYAVFSSVTKSTKYNVIKSGTLNITYNDTDSGLGNIINLNGTYPKTDAEGLALTPYTFKITNTGSLKAKYTVSIVDDTDMIAEDGCSANQLDKNVIKYSVNSGTPALLSSVASNSYIVASGNIEPTYSITYNIRVWLSDTAVTADLNKHFHGKIVIDGSNITE
jgi:hypothetical protein